MNQRNLKWVERNGGLVKLVDAAKAQGVYFVKLTDDKGTPSIAASPPLSTDFAELQACLFP